MNLKPQIIYLPTENKLAKLRVEHVHIDEHKPFYIESQTKIVMSEEEYLELKELVESLLLYLTPKDANANVLISMVNIIKLKKIFNQLKEK